jgi:hypothetical protein
MVTLLEDVKVSFGIASDEERNVSELRGASATPGGVEESADNSGCAASTAADEGILPSCVHQFGARMIGLKIAKAVSVTRLRKERKEKIV